MVRTSSHVNGHDRANFSSETRVKGDSVSVDEYYDSVQVFENLARFIHAMTTFNHASRMVGSTIMNPLALMGNAAMLAPFMDALVQSKHSNLLRAEKRPAPKPETMADQLDRAKQKERDAKSSRKEQEAGMKSDIESVAAGLGLKVKKKAKAKRSKANKASSYEKAVTEVDAKIRTAKTAEINAQMKLSEMQSKENQEALTQAKRDKVLGQIELRIYQNLKDEDGKPDLAKAKSVTAQVKERIEQVQEAKNLAANHKSGTLVAKLFGQGQNSQSKSQGMAMGMAFQDIDRILGENNLRKDTELRRLISFFG